MLDFLLLFAMLGCWAFAWVRILPGPGGLLEPLQRALRLWYARQVNPPASDTYGFGQDIDSKWWWPPVWGCAGCHAGQLAFWCYPIRFFHHYDPLLHLCAVGVAIVTACLLTAQWNRQ